MEVPNLEELKTNHKKKATIVKTDNTKVIQYKSKKSVTGGGGYGTGRRKDAVARVWVRPGKGTIIVNKKDYSQYFTRESYRTAILQPFVDTNTTGQFDVVCTTKGGGTTGQAGAIIHGIARAMDCISEEYHSILRKNGFLTRDSRTVERKKYGRRKARKKVQFSKR